MTQSTHQPMNPPSSERIRDRDLYREGGSADEDPSIARERAEERQRAEARDAARERAEQQGSEDHHDGSPAAQLGTSYLGNVQSDEPWQQWRQIQANFVDNPREAVADAHRLVGQVIDDIVRKFENERNQLEQRWSSGEDVSTEDLRTCLQTYRDFFGRLLAGAGKPS